MNAASPPFIPNTLSERLATAPAIRLRRRLAAFVYEGVVLFGVLMLAGMAYGALTQQRDALQGRSGLQAFVFLVLGAYFIGFWSHGGQTVADKAWHVRVIRRDGQPLTLGQSLRRYLLAWLWFVPGLVVAYVMGWHESAGLYGALLGNVAIYASIALFLPDRQFLHDHLCGTRMVFWDARAERDRARSLSTA